MYKFSAEDIVNQTFERRFRGYDPDQVEEFLAAVAREWEHLRSELEQARDEIESKDEKLEKYEGRQESLQEALEMAKRVSDEIKEKAEREAELTVADAEVEAERIVSRAERKVGELREEIATLKEQRRRYAAELKSVIRSHLEFVEQIDEDDGSSIRRAPEPPDPESTEESDESVSADASSDEAIAVGDGDIEEEHSLREPNSNLPVDDSDDEADGEASRSHPPINDSVH